MTPGSRQSRGPLPEYRGGRCAQIGQTDPMGDVYAAPAFLLGGTSPTPVVTLHVVAKDGCVQLSVDDAQAVCDALSGSLEWLT